MNRHDQSILLGQVLERQAPRGLRKALLWLSSGARNGLGAFCPNAGYVAHIKALAA